VPPSVVTVVNRAVGGISWVSGARSGSGLRGDGRCHSTLLDRWQGGPSVQSSCTCRRPPWVVNSTQLFQYICRLSVSSSFISRFDIAVAVMKRDGGGGCSSTAPSIPPSVPPLRFFFPSHVRAVGFDTTGIPRPQRDAARLTVYTLPHSLRRGATLRNPTPLQELDRKHSGPGCEPTSQTGAVGTGSSNLHLYYNIINHTRGLSHMCSSRSSVGFESPTRARASHARGRGFKVSESPTDCIFLYIAWERKSSTPSRPRTVFSPPGLFARSMQARNVRHYFFKVNTNTWPTDDHYQSVLA